MWFPKELIPELKYLLLGISGIVLFILLNVITGVASAIKRKDFNWDCLLDFLGYNIFPYVLVWGAFSSIPVLMLYWKFPYQEVIVPFETFSVITFTFIIGLLSKSILENCMELFGKDIFTQADAEAQPEGEAQPENFPEFTSDKYKRKYPDEDITHKQS